MAAIAIPAFAHNTGATSKEESGDGHSQMMEDTRRSNAVYAIPQIQLVRADGKAVWLADEINDGRPVVLDFIYTTCSSTCPMSSQALADLQKKLGAASKSVHLVSISIDPENDTPAKLAAYGRKFGAGPSWQFYTGSTEASTTAQRAFKTYRGDKMSHVAVTLVRATPGQNWVRIDGFATSDQLLAELRDSAALRLSQAQPIAVSRAAPLQTSN